MFLMRLLKMMCTAHGSSFNLTTPEVFKQLQAKNIRMSPKVVVVSQKTTVSVEACEYAPLIW